MRKALRGHSWVALLVVPLMLASVASAGEPATLAADRNAISALPQVFEGGLTVEEYFAEQEATFAMLDAAMPGDVLARPVRMVVTDEDLAQLGKSQPGEPLRIGLVKPLDSAIQVANLGSAVTAKDGRILRQDPVRELDDGMLVWAQAVTADGAGGIRLHLQNVSLPDGAELYFFSAEGEAYGPYSGRGPNGDGDFWTESVFSSTGVLMLFAATPDILAGAVFAVTEGGCISPEFTEPLLVGFCGNPDCIEDASCHNGTPAASKAIAKMEWIKLPYIYTCTGGLIADNDPAQANYFLTANHCLSSSNLAKNVTFYWWFATSQCNGTCPSNDSWPYKTTGASVKASNRTGDFTLMQLYANPPSGAVFLGWTTTPVANSNGTHLYRISNPNFGPQVYSAHDVDTSSPTCTGWPRGERIYSADVVGATDGGSSGSPVVNGSSQIVGQLSGCCGYNCGDVCDSANNWTVDGAFAYYFASVEPYLNPGGCVPVPEVCTDGADNDCDGFTDCNDSDCSGDPACQCLPKYSPCSSGSQCCSGKCIRGTCK